MLKNLFIAALAVTGLAFAAPALAATIGEKAPDFTLPAADGGEKTLSSYLGKTVVLEWHNKGCPFVKKHYGSGNMQSLQKDYAAKDVVWLTINSSAEGKQGYETAAEALETVKAANAAPAHVLLDKEGKVGRLYSAATTPTMAVIDKEGKLVYEGAIDDNPSPDAEAIKTSKNYVRAALDAVLEGKPVEVSSTKAYGCGVKYPD